MPYIAPEQRTELDTLIDPLAKKIAERATGLEGQAAFAGLLNYAVTRLTLGVLRERFGTLRYWMIATVTGVLHNAADEFYRRLGHPYEDEQIANNGDVALYRELLQARAPVSAQRPED